MLKLVPLVALAALFFPAEAWAPIAVMPNGGVSGDQVACPGCDVTGIRNLQGGTAGDPNFDIGAGSTDNPGQLAVNFDVGKGFQVYDGHKHLLARFDSSGIVFYRHPKIRRIP